MHLTAKRQRDAIVAADTAECLLCNPRGKPMEALLGFSLGFWDYVTFLALFVLTAGGLGLAVFLLGLPGRIAIARNHPEAEAVYLMGWLGFLAVVPWFQALGWAFRPTSIIDVRYLPRQRRIETQEMIAKLAGKEPPAITPSATPPGGPPAETPPGGPPS